MAWTLTTSGSAIIRAGRNANLSISGSALAQFSDESEGDIVMKTRRNWVTKFDSLSPDLKNALSRASSAQIANDIVNYDLTGYTRSEAQTVLNKNDDDFKIAMRDLKDFTNNEIKDP